MTLVSSLWLDPGRECGAKNRLSTRVCFTLTFDPAATKFRVLDTEHGSSLSRVDTTPFEGASGLYSVSHWHQS